MEEEENVRRRGGGQRKRENAHKKGGRGEVGGEQEGREGEGWSGKGSKTAKRRRFGELQLRIGRDDFGESVYGPRDSLFYFFRKKTSR